MPEHISFNREERNVELFTVAAYVLAEKAGIQIPPTQGGSGLDATLLLNGVEVPFVETIREMMRRFSDQIDAEAAKIAYANAKLGKLDALREAIDRADWDIRQRIEDAFSVKLPDSL